MFETVGKATWSHSLKSLRPGGTVVVLTSDHGEEFDEHGGRYHGTTLYDEQIRVPLIIAVVAKQMLQLDGPVNGVLRTTAAPDFPRLGDGWLR